MAELRRVEAQDAALTTATLTHADEPELSQHDQDRAAIETDNRTSTTAALAAAHTDNHTDSEDQPTPLFSSAEANDLHGRWDAIQVGFVDEPRQAVERADSLVAGAMKRLAEGFAEERSRLEKQWDRGDSVSTEDLRLALRRYRSFFGRLLSV